MEKDKDTSGQNTSLTLMGESIRSVRDIELDIQKVDPQRLLSLNLHKNLLRDFVGLERFTSLTSLNLSSNQLSDAVIQSCAPYFGHLRSLTALDLSANRITDLKGLPSLPQLERLLLPYNKLQSLDGLQVVGTSITYLDLRCNRLYPPLEQHCRILRKFTHLRELYLESNPLVKSQGYNPGAIFNAGIVNLEKLDGRTGVGHTSGMSTVNSSSPTPKFDVVAERYRQLKGADQAKRSQETRKRKLRFSEPVDDRRSDSSTGSSCSATSDSSSELDSELEEAGAAEGGTRMDRLQQIAQSARVAMIESKLELMERQTSQRATTSPPRSRSSTEPPSSSRREGKPLVSRRGNAQSREASTRGYRDDNVGGGKKRSNPWAARERSIPQAVGTAVDAIDDTRQRAKAALHTAHNVLEHHTSNSESQHCHCHCSCSDGSDHRMTRKRTLPAPEVLHPRVLHADASAQTEDYEKPSPLPGAEESTKSKPVEYLAHSLWNILARVQSRRMATAFTKWERLASTEIAKASEARHREAQEQLQATIASLKSDLSDAEIAAAQFAQDTKVSLAAANHDVVMWKTAAECAQAAERLSSLEVAELKRGKSDAEAEVESLLQEIDRLRGEAAKARRQEGTAIAARESAEAEVALLTARLAGSIQSAQDRTNVLIDEHKREVLALQKQMAGAEEEVRRLTAEASAVQRSLREQLATAQASAVQSAEGNATKRQLEVASIQAELNKEREKVSLLQEKVGTLESAIQQLSTVARGARASAQEAEAREKKARAAAAELSQMVRSQRSALHQFKSDLETANSDRKRLERELSHAMQLGEEAARRLAELGDGVDVSSRAAEEAIWAKANEKFANEQKDLALKLESLQHEYDHIRSCLSVKDKDLREIAASKDMQLQELTAKVRSLKAEIEAAMDGKAAEEARRCALEEDLEAAMTECHDLKKKVYAVTCMEEQLSNFFQDMQKLKAHLELSESAAKTKELETSSLISALEEKFKAQIEVKEASIRYLEGELLALKSEFEDRCQALKETADKERGDAENRSQAIAELQKQLQNQKDALENASMVREAAESEIAQLQKQLEKHRAATAIRARAFQQLQQLDS